MFLIQLLRKFLIIIGACIICLLDSTDVEGNLRPMNRVFQCEGSDKFMFREVEHKGGACSPIPGFENTLPGKQCLETVCIMVRGQTAV